MAFFSFKRTTYGTVLFAVLALLACLTLLPANSHAQVQSSCDPEYMDALEARAWLEAQREITQNQNLIFKPDSVLEYTCFDRFLETVAGAEMFSESGCCGGPPRPGTLDAALTQVVGAALGAYLAENFPHSFLGGRANVDYQADPIIGGGGYVCNSMRIAWDAAKCMHFFDQPSIDAFFDFPWYAGADPRQLPPAPFLQCTPHPETGNTINVAFNGEQNLYTLGGENPWPYDQTPYEEDPVITHLNLILPVGVGPAGGCAPAIPTGVCVLRQNMAPYADAVCPNPGCHYEAPGGGGGGGGATECPADPPIGQCVQ